MNPRDVSGQPPGALTSDQGADENSQVVSRLVTFYIGTSDESEGERDRDREPDVEPEVRDEVDQNEPGVNILSSNSSDNQDEEHDEEEIISDDEFFYPVWNLQPVDEKGEPCELYKFRLRTLRCMVARSQVPNFRIAYEYMQQAVYCGSEEVVSTLLTLGLDPNDRRARLLDDSTLLHLAASRRHSALVHLLLRHGARIDAVCKHGCTALHVAAISGCLRSTVLLAGAGASVYARDRNGHSPVCYALAYRQDEVFRALQAFRVVLKSKCKHGKKFWRRKGEETSSGQHSFMMLFPRGV